MKKSNLAVFSILSVILLTGCIPEKSSREVQLFRIFEIKLAASQPGSNPYLNGPEVSAKFTGTSGKAKGKTFVITGFWDGNNDWRIRFAPTLTGGWSYETTSTDPGLNRKRGSLTAVHQKGESAPSNILYNGFLELNDTFSWKLSNGTPFLPVGETQWSFSEEFLLSEWKEWIDVLAECNYNSFMGCAWLGKYTRAEIYPFEKRDPQTDKLLVRFFKEQLDPMVQYANDKGIMMGIVIGGFPDNSQWFQKFNTLERNERWFKYIIARYAAYNVRWGLFGEINEAAGRFALEDKSWQWVGRHFSQLIKDTDPYKHPAGSHNTRVDTSAATDPNIDFIEVQEGDRKSPTQYLNAQDLRKWNKPVWYEEYWYEMDGDQNVGIHNTHRNFISALAFPTMGSLMRNHYGIDSPFPPDEAKRQGIPLYDFLMKNDTGIVRMSYFADFYKILVNDLDDFTPATELINRGECSRFGKNLAIFLPDGGSFTLDLSAVKSDFNVLRLDIRTGDTLKLKSISGGRSCYIDSKSDSDAVVLLISDR